MEEFNAKQKELEKTLADARARVRESDVHAESQRLQQRIDKLSRQAKTTESRSTVQCLELTRRTITTAKGLSVAVDYCREALQ